MGAAVCPLRVAAIRHEVVIVLGIRLEERLGLRVGCRHIDKALVESKRRLKNGED